jgi:O-antigen/teichoic acid export membrane protein
LSKPFNKDDSSQQERDFFQTTHLKSNLKQRSIRGGAITVTAQAFKFLLMLASNIWLARLLTPEDMGLVTKVMAIVGFMTLFKDLGLSMATVQREEIDHAQVSALFWVNVAFSLLAGVVTAALAPLIAQFYQDARLIPITLALAAGIALGGLGTQHAALLQRQMQYSKLAACEILSQFIGVSSAIAAAWQGAGYWALVIYPLVVAIMLSLSVIVVCGWLPGRPRWAKGTDEMLRFGGNLTGFGLINYMARNFDNILIGKYVGTAQLGLYAKAYQLLVLPLNQINEPIRSVAVPLLSQLLDTPERYRRTYLKILQKLMLITMPLVIYMIATADWLIAILLGEQWQQATPIYVCLGFSGLLQPVASSAGWLFISQGRTDRMFRWGIMSTVLTISSFCIGLPFGAIGVAASYSAIGVLITNPLLFWYVGRCGPVKMKDFYIAASPILVASLVTSLALLSFRGFWHLQNPLLNCLIAVGITIISFLSILMFLPSGRSIVKEVRNFKTILIPP